jgi:hypothetical protein
VTRDVDAKIAVYDSSCIRFSIRAKKRSTVGHAWVDYTALWNAPHITDILRKLWHNSRYANSRYVFSEKAPLLIVKLIYSLKVFRAGIHGARERTYVPSMHLLNKSVHASVITLVNSSLVKNERDTARRLP